jgi:hypothetical protein
MRGMFVVMFIRYQTVSHPGGSQTNTRDMENSNFSNLFIVCEHWIFLKEKVLLAIAKWFK